MKMERFKMSLLVHNLLITADHRLFFSVLCWKHICAALQYLTPSDPMADDGLRISQLI